MAKKTATVADTKKLFEALGIGREQVIAAFGLDEVTAQKARRNFTVELTEGEDVEKYGDVRITKVSSTGRPIKGLVFKTEDLAHLIGELTAAQEALA